MFHMMINMITGCNNDIHASWEQHNVISYPNPAFFTLERQELRKHMSGSMTLKSKWQNTVNQPRLRSSSGQWRDFNLFKGKILCSLNLYQFKDNAWMMCYLQYYVVLGHSIMSWYGRENGDRRRFFNRNWLNNYHIHYWQAPQTKGINKGLQASHKYI